MRSISSTLRSLANRRPHAPGGRAHQRVRQFVEMRVVELLMKTEIGKASAGAFRFQAPGGCLANTGQMQKDVEAALVESGLVSGGSGNKYEFGVDVSGDEMMKLNHKHGPLQLQLACLVRPDQGLDAYDRFHAALLLASFQHRGRAIGILLDGNDRQNNRVTQLLDKFLGERGKTRENLADFSEHELDNIIEEAQRLIGGEPADAMQLGFRLVDLNSLADASRDRFKRKDSSFWAPIDSVRPNHTWYKPSMETHQPALSEDVTAELAEIIEADPSLVEVFEDWGGSSNTAGPLKS